MTFLFFVSLLSFSCFCYSITFIIPRAQYNCNVFLLTLVGPLDIIMVILEINEVSEKRSLLSKRFTFPRMIVILVIYILFFVERYKLLWYSLNFWTNLTWYARSGDHDNISLHSIEGGLGLHINVIVCWLISLKQLHIIKHHH